MFKMYSLKDYRFRLCIYVAALTVIGIFVIGSARESVQNKQVFGMAVGIVAMICLSLFDYSFLKKAAVDKKLSFEKNAIDTLKIARKYLTDLEHRSLDYLCQHYQIEHHAHRALEDARATHFLYHKLVELFYEKETQECGAGNLFLPSPLHFQIKRDTPATKAQKEQLYRLLEQHKIVMSVEIERLTRSEASRWIDRIKSGALTNGAESPLYSES